MSVGQRAADLTNEGNALVARVREIVNNNPRVAQHMRDTRLNAATIPSDETAALARLLAPHNRPLNEWRQRTQNFLETSVDELEQGWPEIATQLGRTFDNTTYALEYTQSATGWVRVTTGGILPALREETGRALATGAGLAFVVIVVVVLVAARAK